MDTDHKPDLTNEEIEAAVLERLRSGNTQLLVSEDEFVGPTQMIAGWNEV